MDKARVYVDLNEMVTDSIVLLSKYDTKVDDKGSIITFYEGMPVSLYSDDMSDSGEIEKHPNDLVAVQKILIYFKNHGMSKESMLKNLEKINNQHDFKAKDILLDLMDFVVGWCSQDLSIY